MKPPTQEEINKALYGRTGRGRIKVSPPEERTAEGIVFDSKKEMECWLQFRSLERGGTITNLRRQVRYPLHAIGPNGSRVRITEYRADIVCEDRDGRTCVYDPKGMKTDRYRMIKHWFEVEYSPLRIVEL